MRSLTAWVLLVLGIGCSLFVAEKVSAQDSVSTVNIPTSTNAVVDDVDALIARGIGVYREQLCGMCHRFKRAETEGIFGPAHDGFAHIAVQRIRDETYTGTAQTPAEYVRESIVNPTAFIVPGFESGFHHMPPYRDLTSEDLEALVKLLILEE